MLLVPARLTLEEKALSALLDGGGFEKERELPESGLENPEEGLREGAEGLREGAEKLREGALKEEPDFAPRAAASSKGDASVEKATSVSKRRGSGRNIEIRSIGKRRSLPRNGVIGISAVDQIYNQE
ncbi:MAG: hypothetical protein JWL90_2123 [Chthoniobacteraceae bacterium]|nr:hypothetical protein [Chthoniobacteraceae bacterium]